MARSRQSESQYFQALKTFLQRHAYSQFENYDGFPAPNTNGHPIDLDRMERALRRTAETCLDFDNQLHLHGFESPTKVGQLLRHIAEECKATSHCTAFDLGALAVDVYGVFATAYTYDEDLRSLARTLSNHDSPVILRNRAVAA